MTEGQANPIHAEMVINQVIKDYPQTIGVFNRFEIDSCCGGADTLRVGSEKVGADVEAVVEALNTALLSVEQ
jgi:iron-sulfur cluster repair protein YtfE (RIC family)